MDDKFVSPRSRSLPTRYVPVGEIVERYGVRLRCVERRPVHSFSAACKGCWFRRCSVDGTIVNCNDIQCSRWDRMDGRNVWFVEEIR